MQTIRHPTSGFRLQQRCERLKTVAHYPPRTFVLRIVPPDSAAIGANACADIRRIVGEEERAREARRRARMGIK